MRFIQESGYTVKVGQEEAHQRWLAENEERLARAHPEGVRYLGTFAVVVHRPGWSAATTTYPWLANCSATKVPVKRTVPPPG